MVVPNPKPVMPVFPGALRFRPDTAIGERTGARPAAGRLADAATGATQV